MMAFRRAALLLSVLAALTVGAHAQTGPIAGGSATPTGSAGGDLSGTYPNPTVAKVNGANVIASVTTQQFVASANPTYTAPAKLIFAIVECIGQGGGGGGAAASATGVSSGGGGGSGSYSRIRLTAAQIGASQAITNTAAANGGATGANPGTAGNDTSFGALCIGKGGSGGGGAATTANGAGGAGGVAGTGDLAIAGTPGGRGEGASITTVLLSSGYGGTGPWGGGAIGVEGNATAVSGNAGTICGGGGSGGQSEGSASTAAGGQGGNGCVIVTEYNSQ